MRLRGSDAIMLTCVRLAVLGVMKSSVSDLEILGLLPASMQLCHSNLFESKVKETIHSS